MQIDEHDLIGKNKALCPFLGFCEDPSTALSYPSEQNCCFKAKPVVSVNAQQQSKYCLNVHYAFCPVYQKEETEVLPKELRGNSPRWKKPKKWMSILALVCVVIAGLIASILLGILPLPGSEGIAINKSATPISTSPLPSIPSLALESTSTPTQMILPTETLTEVPPTEAAPHFLETPIGQSPQLIVHKLREGDGYILLAQTYNTTESAIKAVNFQLPESLLVGKILVIPYNTNSVEGFPQFSAYEIIEDGLTIEKLSGFLKIEASLLKQYNSLPDGYTFAKGEWVLIPH